MASLRAAAKQIDWTKLSNTLPSETVAALQAFRKRNDEAKRLLNELKEQSTTVDFAYYRNVLKNQAIVDQAEKAVQGFKPVAYNLDAQLKAIDQFEAKAVSFLYYRLSTCTNITLFIQVEKASSTVQKIDAELKDLQATLGHIEGSRPIEQLTVCIEYGVYYCIY